MKSNAEKHAEIAKKVFIDAKVKVVDGWGSDLVPVAYCTRQRLQSEPPTLFDLLATDPDGTPTTQAKADALDVLEWLARHDSHAYFDFRYLAMGMFDNDNPCEAIFNAACEVVK